MDELTVRGRIGLGVVVVLLVALLCASHASASALPGRNGRIAALGGGFNFQDTIAVVAKGGRLWRPYSSGTPEAILSGLGFSPSGARVILTEAAGSPERSLDIYNLRRRRLEPVGTGGLSVSRPAFLANGNIVFSGGRYPSGARSGTYLAGRQGGKIRRLFGREQLAVSADGRWFVATDRGGNFHSLFLLDRHGRQVRRLTPNPKFRYLNPSFSPNGRLIAFEMDVERPGTAADRTDIFIVRRNGRRLRRVTFSRDSSHPVFSPNGRWLAYMAGGGFGSPGNITVLPLASPRKTKQVTRIVDARFQDPTWERR